MGSVLGKQMSSIMDENLKKNQEFMLATQKMQVSPKNNNLVWVPATAWPVQSIVNQYGDLCDGKSSAFGW